MTICILLKITLQRVFLYFSKKGLTTKSLGMNTLFCGQFGDSIVNTTKIQKVLSNMLFYNNLDYFNIWFSYNLKSLITPRIGIYFCSKTWLQSLTEGQSYVFHSFAEGRPNSRNLSFSHRILELHLPKNRHLKRAKKLYFSRL